jgi:hypothetical protein
VVLSLKKSTETTLPLPFTAVKIQVDVFRVVTPCSVEVGYRRFGGPESEVTALLTINFDKEIVYFLVSELHGHV